MTETTPSVVPLCERCGVPCAKGLLSCPACGALVHRARLESLRAQAEGAEEAGDKAASLTAWRDALELLPVGSQQRVQVGDHIRRLSASVGEGASPKDEKKGMPRLLGALGSAGLLIWKGKWLLGLLLGKGKLLLLGLTKGQTLLTMLLSVGVYWAIWGWPFALGVVLCIYVHEMGHVASLRRYGVRASAPMFIPGIGAYVRLEQKLASTKEDARVGLAGPWWGLGASAASFAIYYATGEAIFAAIARFSAWINLFNLMPIWQLDGGRGFAALSRAQRWACVAALGTAALWVHDGLLILILIVAAGRAAFSKPSEEDDRSAMWQYIALVGMLAALSAIHVPGLEGRIGGPR